MNASLKAVRWPVAGALLWFLLMAIWGSASIWYRLHPPPESEAEAYYESLNGLGHQPEEELR